MPEGKIPAEVERYVDEFKEKGYDESYAWAMAWSRFCKYKSPGSSQCKQDSYLDGKRNPMSSRIATIIMNKG